jgi:ribosomal protein S24E
MELNIIDKKEHKLLSRLEVKATISFGSNPTPSNQSVKDALAKNLEKDIKLVVIKHIYTKYGDTSANVEAYVYDNEIKLKELEKKDKKSKDNDSKEDQEEAIPVEKSKEAKTEK